MSAHFYEAPSEDAPAFVKVGDTVKKGQTLGIVEAMKLMNEIESEFDGVVKEIYVQNESLWNTDSRYSGSDNTARCF